MSTLVMGTSAVSMDEPAYSLKELNLQSPGSRGWHRYQIITVIRSRGTQPAVNEQWCEQAPCFDLGMGYGLTELRRDLGPVNKFTVGQFTIPGGVTDSTGGRTKVEILHTVGELIDIADLLRSDHYERPEPPKAIDLIQGYHDSFEKRRLRARGRSMFGPAARIQRG